MKEGATVAVHNIVKVVHIKPILTSFDGEHLPNAFSKANFLNEAIPEIVLVPMRLLDK